MADSAYTAALRLLARRDLSEAQIRLRLARRQYEAGAVDDAIERLKANGGVDDVRVAAGIARIETDMRKRGRIRVRRQIEAAGISPDVAQQAVDLAFGALDADALLAASLARRLRGRDHVADDREQARLYRYLLGQGFESDRVRAALRRLRTSD